jgi:hypothetical protein
MGATSFVNGLHGYRSVTRWGLHVTLAVLGMSAIVHLELAIKEAALQ